ncbi:MAG: hypothetical protein DRQ51_07825 [Gammaproteobacteria bacterium]|nr:MAG: hypothetical protein DRQ51_07825 [Gammaproteobacteria bacterium]
MKKIKIVSALGFFALALFAVIGWSMGMNTDAPMSRGAMGGMTNDSRPNFSQLRHRYVMQNGLDKNYLNKISPLGKNADLKQAKSLYNQNCANCHGAGGKGDGVAGAALKPTPADIATFTKTHMATDGYLLWTISEGGLPIKSAMPSFKSILTEQQIWHIVAYIRNF